MDFDEPAIKVVKQEFIAVVLAGFGTELTPLTSNHGDEPCPKALLPIANKSMLDYPLRWLDESGIRDVLLVCPARHKAAMSHYINSDSSISTFPSLRIDLQIFDETAELGVGTCAVMRHFANRIKQDFVLLPCDFVPSPSFSLTRVLDKFRTEATYDGSIATTCFFHAHTPEKGASTEEWGLLPAPTPIVWDEPSGTLLYIDTPEDVDNNPTELELSMSLLSSYPRTKLSGSLQDAHVYVCRRSILDLLQEKMHLDSIREEFIPWLCKLQYSRNKRAKYGNILNPPSNAPNLALDSQHDIDGEETLTFASPSLRVGIVVHRAEDGYAARANTLQSYLELNRHFLSKTTYALPSDSESRALIDPKAQISSNSMVGHTTKVEERTSIKKSVIGKHCVIGKMVKIVGCVILDHCVISDGVKLDGCILGKNTKVGAKAELSRCVTQAGYEVDAGETYRNEKLELSDWTARHGSTDEDDEDESEESDDS